MLKKFDSFTRNIILVFAGSSLANIFGLLFQLLIAHKLTAPDFAAFNSMLSIFVIFSTPLTTLQLAVAKYSSGFRANNEPDKLRLFLSGFLRKLLVFSVFTSLVFLFFSFSVLEKLKIPSVSCGFILSGLFAASWISPLFTGAAQGLELFGWLSFSSVFSGALKLILAFIFIWLGFGISGTVGALLLSSLFGFAIFYIPLRKFFVWRKVEEVVDFKEILLYFLPLAIGSGCFIALVNSDMLLVRYYFSTIDSGLYALGQMVGKIFLFLPGAVSLVMFPRTSGINAKNLSALPTLKKSLLYVFILCSGAFIFYNIFPGFVLKVLTGKVYPDSIALGRLFGISMSFFAMLFLLVTYFVSIKDFRFIKFVIASAVLQVLAILLFHNSLIQVQVILCINSVLLFANHLFLAFRNERH